MFDRLIQLVNGLHQGAVFELLVFFAGSLILIAWCGVILGQILLIRQGWRLGKLARKPTARTVAFSEQERSIPLKGAYVKGTLIGFPDDNLDLVSQDTVPHDLLNE